MTRYDIIEARRVMLTNVLLHIDLMIFFLYSCELGKIVTWYDFLEVRGVILSSVKPTPTLPNLIFGQLFLRNDFEQCLYLNVTEIHFWST